MYAITQELTFGNFTASSSSSSSSSSSARRTTMGIWCVQEVCVVMSECAQIYIQHNIIQHTGYSYALHPTYLRPCKGKESQTTREEVNPIHHTRDILYNRFNVLEEVDVSSR